MLAEQRICLIFRCMGTACYVSDAFGSEMTGHTGHCGVAGTGTAGGMRW